MNHLSLICLSNSGQLYNCCEESAWRARSLLGKSFSCQWLELNGFVLGSVRCLGEFLCVPLSFIPRLITKHDSGITPFP